MERKHVMITRIPAAICLLLLLTACVPGQVTAGGGPARTETLAAGPYVVDVNLYKDPPVTDQWVRVTVAPHNAGLRLSGYLVTVPGLATDAVPIHFSLSRTGRTGALAGTIHMPVRGAWQLLVELDGRRGHGEAMVPITVAGPGAMPIWLAWLIGLSPLLAIAWLIGYQTRYRRVLLRTTRQPGLQEA